MTSLRGARVFTGGSCSSFVLGLYFPLMVLLDPGPSAMAYGIVLVSFPAWAVGVLSGGVAGYLEWRAGPVAPRLERFAWLLGGLNLVAVVLCLIWRPAGISWSEA